VKVTAEECPRISKEFLEEERKSMGDWWFNQEYLCIFSQTSSQYFSTELIEAAFSDEVEPLFPGDPTDRYRGPV
jgi:phage FluMu gp28-like protein